MGHEKLKKNVDGELQGKRQRLDGNKDIAVNVRQMGCDYTARFERRSFAYNVIELRIL
jgi:hypothetical protein